jgi:hypothetical protein
MAEMIPERFDALVTRGARYGYSRIVLGVHYPLDVMGSRMVAQRNVAHLNDPTTARCLTKPRSAAHRAGKRVRGSLAECAKTERRSVSRSGDARFLSLHHDLRSAAAKR